MAQTEAALDHEVQALEAQVQKTLMEAKSVENTIFSTLGEQMAVEKGTQNTATATDKLRTQREDKEDQLATMQNEMARIHVDALNTRSHNSELETQLNTINSELADKDSLVARYQTEARRRATEIEKKQHELDLLNKKFDALMKQRAGVADLDEDAGPLEATIVHLKKEINHKMEENAELQRNWIKNQTELVTVQNSNQAVAERVHDMRAKLSILAQKQTRIEAQFEKQERELKELSRGSASLHNEMSRINQLLADQSSKQQTLADDNFILEHEFVVKLKELEAEAVAMEAQIVGLKEQKEGLLLDVTEAEKQVMLLEKKIALERETQAALDPEVGAAEVRAMEREIHRMRLRYAQLQRRQEQMIAEMERQIYKRDNIEAKGKVIATRKGAPPTQAVLQKQLADLSKKLQHGRREPTHSVLNLQEQRRRGRGGGGGGRASWRRCAARGALITSSTSSTCRRPQTRTQAALAARLLAEQEGRYTPAASAGAREQPADGDDTAARLLTVVENLSQEHPSSRRPLEYGAGHLGTLTEPSLHEGGGRGRGGATCRVGAGGAAERRRSSADA